MEYTPIGKNINRLEYEAGLFRSRLVNCQDDKVREAYKCKLFCIETEIEENKKLLEEEKSNMINAVNYGFAEEVRERYSGQKLHLNPKGGAEEYFSKKFKQ